MVWAMDQVDQKLDNGLGIANGVTNAQQSDARQMAVDQQASNVACYTSDCGDTCKTGTFEVTEMSGQPGQLSTADRCAKGKYRSLCCTDGTTLGKCQWRGFRGAGLSCIGGCASDKTDLGRNTNHHDDSIDQTCNGGLQSFCCSGFKAPPSKSELASAAEDAANEAAEAAAEQVALDIAAKAFCRIAVPALLVPLELLEDLIPIIGKSRCCFEPLSPSHFWPRRILISDVDMARNIGEILDIAELAATPALIQACVKGVEKEGKAEFKVFGKEHTITYDKPTEKPTSRPPESTHTPASTKSETTCQANKKRINLRTDTRAKQYDNYDYVTTRRTCDGVAYPQACWHYSSVIEVEPEVNSLLTCTDKALRAPRAIPPIYSNADPNAGGQHNGGWITGWMQSYGINCERDEFPPAIIWQGRGDSGAVWIRFLPKTQNSGAGQLFNGICDDTPSSHTTNRAMDNQGVQDCRPWESWTSTVVTTFSVLDLQFAGMGAAVDHALAANPCYPKTLGDDPGFALMFEDPWYDTHSASLQFARASYPSPPSFAVTQNKQNRSGYNKRGSDGLDISIDPADIVVVDGNSTRKATDEELLHNFAVLRCAGKDCRAEQEELGIESVPLFLPPRTVVENVLASTTFVAAMVNVETTATPQVESRTPSSPELPRATNSAEN